MIVGLKVGSVWHKLIFTFCASMTSMVAAQMCTDKARLVRSLSPAIVMQVLFHAIKENSAKDSSPLQPPHHSVKLLPLAKSVAFHWAAVCVRTHSCYKKSRGSLLFILDVCLLLVSDRKCEINYQNVLLVQSRTQQQLFWKKRLFLKSRKVFTSFVVIFFEYNFHILTVILFRGWVI